MTLVPNLPSITVRMKFPFKASLRSQFRMPCRNARQESRRLVISIGKRSLRTAQVSFAVVLLILLSGCSLYRSQARKVLENSGIDCAKGVQCSAAAMGMPDCRPLTEQDIELFSPNDAHVVFDADTQSYLWCR